MASRVIAFLVALVAFVAPAAGADGAIPCEFQAEGRVVVIGDTFADYDGFVAALRDAELIDEHDNWIGGNAHLVQTGDIFPRDREWPSLDVVAGDHERVARLLMKLEKEAPEDGGQVHSLMGWLEVLMLRWRVESIYKPMFDKFAADDPNVAQRELDELNAAWMPQHWDFVKDYPNAEQLRENFVNFQKAFFRPGCVEFFRRVDPGTELGDWLRARNAVIRINDVVYAHAGISPRDAGVEKGASAKSLQELNDGVRDVANARVGDFPKLFLPVQADTQDPIFWRSLPLLKDSEIQRLVESALQAYDARAMVVGVAPKRRIDRQGALFFVDSNLGSETANKVRGVLVIDGDKYTILENGRTTERGDLPPAPDARVIEGQPENPQKPGGGPPRMDPPKKN